jgi:APA family basic amino acid/polyamine antiporter
MANLWARKPLSLIMDEAHETGEHSLKRALGSLNLISLGIGAIIGTGIFVLTGAAASQYAGPGVVFSFVLAGIGCVFAGLCYAEFASMIPVAGSAYTYGYATLGEFIAWIIGWDLILEYAFGAATVASGWSGYVLSFANDFGLKLPPSLAGTRWDTFVLYDGHWEKLARVGAKLQSLGVDPASLPHTTGQFNLIAFIGIALVTTILVIGIKESANFNNFIVIAKLAVLLIFLGIGAHWLTQNPAVASSNWTPFVPPNEGEFGKYGWSGVLRAAGVIFFAYIGFDAVSTAAQEARNPQKDMPKGILGSLVVCTILYILVALVLTGIVNYRTLNVPDPIAIGIDATGVKWGSFLVKIGAIAGLSSTMVVMLLGQSRVFFSMSRDGLLPPVFSRVHTRFRTPYLSSIFVGLFVGIFAALIPVNILGELVSIGTLLAFVIVCAGIWVLRRTNPELPRPFRTPMVPLVPILGIVISAAMMLGLPTLRVQVVGIEPELIIGGTWLRLLVWLVIGLFVYFFYSIRKSRVQRGLPIVKEEDVPTR